MIKRGQDNRCFLWILVMLAIGISSCDNEPADINDPVDVIPKDSLNPHINDDYSAIAEKTFSTRWGPYNLHDP
ncbi:MAG: hypothetical protein KAT15_26960, partial [Bacteroidales bacterium]|nr:hypothetical protein [Bacteroidales bacterium]